MEIFFAVLILISIISSIERLFYFNGITEYNIFTTRLNNLNYGTQQQTLIKYCSKSPLNVRPADNGSIMIGCGMGWPMIHTWVVERKILQNSLICLNANNTSNEKHACIKGSLLLPGQYD